MMDYRAREYDPGTRRFLQKDPLGMVDGTNLYAYVGNNPVNRVDPSGTGWVYTGHVNCAGLQACVRSKVNYDPGVACLVVCGAAVAACIILIATVVGAPVCPIALAACGACWVGAYAMFSAQLITCLLGNTYRWQRQWDWGYWLPFRLVCGG